MLYFVDPFTGKEKSRTAGTADEREAERAASKWEVELAEWYGEDGATWLYFRERFEQEHLAFLAEKSANAYATALNRFEDFANPSSLTRITTSVLSQFAASLLKQHPQPTVKNYVTHVRSALSWAASVGIIQKVPAFKLPRVPNVRHMRGRALTVREVGEMLRACRRKFPDDHAQWRRFIKLLFYSGLRIGEAYKLSWDSPPIQVMLDAKPYPLILIDAEAQKSRQDQAIPMTPELVAWLSRTPRSERKGRVADVRTTTGTRFSVTKLGVRIGEIGVESGVIVQTEPEKHASAHDLRKSFGTRWAAKVRPITLQKMMRHSTLGTTLKFYVGLSAADVGTELWNLKES